MRWLAALVFLSGCDTLPHHVTTIPRLRAAAESAVVQQGVIVSIEPITNFNWRSYPEITAKLSILVHDTSQSVSAGSAGAPKLALRFEDMLLMPLPAFRLRVSNQSQLPLSFANVRARLEDDTHAVESLDAATVRAEIDHQALERRNRANGAINADQLSSIRGVIEHLPLLKKEAAVPPQEEWRGYASFHFESEQPVTHLVMVLEGLTLDGKPLPPFRFPFVVERRHAQRACKDGSAATPLGVCPGDAEELAPAAEGPCIQHTRVPNSDKGTQWWVGGEAVANSDLHSTLMSQEESRATIRRGLIMRGFGYALILSGLGLAATSSYAIARNHGSNLAPAGLSLLSIAVVGGGLSWKGAQRTESAIRAYNEQADAGGVCSVVW